MAMAYLECRDLKRIFPGKFTLDLSFSMDKGELMCVIGPSGSGKSTLLSLLCGVDDPDEGRIVIDGTDITDLSIQKRRIGMVFQDFSLFPSMDVAANIQYGMRGLEKPEKERRTTELLQLVGLDGYENRRVHELSGGEAQRIALARAIASEPRILLLDEPLSSLDAPLRKHLRTVIRQIQKNTGITMIYVTHDREEAFAIADRVMVMRGGRIGAIGTPQDIYNNPSSLFVARFTGEGSAIPMSYISRGIKESMVFIRPEAVEINKTNPSEDDVVLKDAVVQNSEFTGSEYYVRLKYKDVYISAYSSVRPDSEKVDLYIRRDRITDTIAE